MCVCVFESQRVLKRVRAGGIYFREQESSGLKVNNLGEGEQISRYFLERTLRTVGG